MHGLILSLVIPLQTFSIPFLCSSQIKDPVLAAETGMCRGVEIYELLFYLKNGSNMAKPIKLLGQQDTLGNVTNA